MAIINSLLAVVLAFAVVLGLRAFGTIQANRTDNKSKQPEPETKTGSEQKKETPKPKKKISWKKIGWALAGAVVLYLGYYVYSIFNTWQNAVVCPPGSMTETRTCVLNARGSEWFKSEDSVPSGPNLCYYPSENVSCDRREEYGRAWWRFSPQRKLSVNERVTVRYRFIRGTCPPYAP